MAGPGGHCSAASVADPSPFALSTQLDKGLDSDVAYMALRLAEDAAPWRCSAPSRCTCHSRGPAPRLHQRARPVRRTARRRRHGPSLADALAPRVRDPDLVLAPQAIGDHVDHRVVVDVVRALAGRAVLARQPVRAPPAGAPAWQSVPRDSSSPWGSGAPRDGGRRRPGNGTQLGFQFGGPDRVAADLDTLARPEARRLGAPGPCEVFLGASVIRP